jgi:hypothetical protein
VIGRARLLEGLWVTLLVVVATPVVALAAYYRGGSTAGAVPDCVTPQPSPTGSISPSPSDSSTSTSPPYPDPSVTIQGIGPSQTSSTDPNLVCASQVSIDYSERKDSFVGRVRSDAPECVDGRVVHLRKVRSGPDRKMGRDVAGSSGKWREGGFENPTGRFYALVKAMTVKRDDGVTVECMADRSKKINP